MKIGVITFAHGNDNYGGTLQALAMQTAVERLGHEAFLVNTDSGMTRGLSLKILEHPVREIQRFRRYRKFIDFWKRYFHDDPAGHSDFGKYMSKSTNVDAYVCGSDQVWGMGWPSSEASRRFYFAGFGRQDAKRVAYAPGWSARELPQSCKEDVRSLLSKFDSLSAREDNGVRLMADLGLKAECVIDPTLLFTKEFWGKYAEEKPREAKLILMNYRWKTVLNVHKAIKQLKALIKAKFVTLSSERFFDFPFSNLMVTPSEWLAEVRDAKFVLTNSFHCAVFSIIFHKPFAVFALEGRYDAQNERFYSLLNRLGLSGRIVRTCEDLTRIVGECIDWESVDGKLASMRETSWQYLRNALG